MNIRPYLTLYNKLSDSNKSRVRGILVSLKLMPWAEQKYFDLNAPMVSPLLHSSDLTWSQFEAQILRYRDDYRGVFVQDRVIPWNMTLYQRPQHLAVAMAKLGYLVIYQTHPFGDDSGIRDVRQVVKNVWVTHLDEALKIPGAIRSTYSGVPLEQIRHERNQKLIYEYVDHLDAKIVGHDALEKLEAKKKRAFAGNADIVLASANKLFEEAKESGDQVLVSLVPNGVDIAFFDAISESLRCPPELAEFKAKHKFIVGYFGAVAPWLWYDVINPLVEQSPEIGFVLIGPDYNHGLKNLQRRSNLLLTGAVSYTDLPHYSNEFDVALIPFEPGEIAKTTSPLKLFEYFAMGKPVVVTADMAECVQYEGVFPASNLQEFKHAISQALIAGSDGNFVQTILNNARSNSWEKRALQIDQLVSGGTNE